MAATGRAVELQLVVLLLVLPLLVELVLVLPLLVALALVLPLMLLLILLVVPPGVVPARLLVVGVHSWWWRGAMCGGGQATWLCAHGPALPPSASASTFWEGSATRRFRAMARSLCQVLWRRDWGPTRG